MADPVLQTGYWVGYYQCDRDPIPTEDPLKVYTNLPDFLEFWWNTVSGDIFVCTDNTLDAMVWHKLVDDHNISDVLLSLGISPPVARSRTQRTSPAFSTSYRPSTTSDVEVNLTLNITAALGFSSVVNIQVSEDNSSWTTIYPFTKSLTLGVNENHPITFTVPIGSYYRIIQATGTAASIISIYELTV